MPKRNHLQDARGHVTGSVKYVRDHLPTVGEWHIVVVLSTIARGLIKAINCDAARANAAVRIFTAADIPGKRLWGPITADEPILLEAGQTISYHGQPILLVAAPSLEQARRAARQITLEVDPLPAVLTLAESIDRGAALTEPKTITLGDVDQALADAPGTVELELTSGGQQHLYFETQTATAVWDGKRLLVRSSNQSPTKAQEVIAAALGLAMSQIVVEAPPMGGAFGGKETQATLPAVHAALVAYLTGSPARIELDRETDTRMTGGRNPFRTVSKVGFTLDGVITARDTSLYANGGAFLDLSGPINDRARFHANNAYFVPNTRIRGQVFATNTAPNTAFRSFGGVQGVAAIEHAMEVIAYKLGKDPLDVRYANIFDDEGGRNVLPYGQVVKYNHLRNLMAHAEEKSDYRQWVKRIAAENAANPRWIQGIALVPNLFGISFTTDFLNQASALVHVYKDGSVHVSTGGTEMGQGLYSQIRTVCAEAFGLDSELVLVGETSTEKNANTTPSAASSTFSLNGGAVLIACQQIKERLCLLAAELLETSADQICIEGGFVSARSNPDKKLCWKVLCEKAFLKRVNLSAHAYYAPEGIRFDEETQTGTPFLYHAQGASVARIRLDRYSGEVVVDSFLSVADVGKPVDELIAKGQYYGGIVQGIGLMTIENVVHDGDGKLLTSRFSTYPVPAIGNMPKEFDVEFVDCGDDLPIPWRAKAIGEPPLMHAVAVWAAIFRAVSSLSFDAACMLRIPATRGHLLEILERTSPPRD